MSRLGGGDARSDATDARLIEALVYLDDHVNFETAADRRIAPTLERMRKLCAFLGDPQRTYPALHVTGTNGKGSTVRMASGLLSATGLRVGTYTSPHLQRLNERITVDGESIAEEELAERLLSLAPVEEHLGLRLTHFEVLTATALSYFADVAIDVAVLEVGMGGRWDSTNVVDADVAVVTNVALDHAETIGPTRVEIAREKAGIIKAESALILGETDPALVEIFRAEPAETIWQRDEDFGCARNVVAHGGRAVDVRTPLGVHEDIYVPLHGPHQGDNAAAALAGVEAFFRRPLDDDLIIDAFAGVRVPGRFEIVGRRPLVVLDGAHNPAGAAALSWTLDDDFAGRRPDIVVVGFTAGRDPVEMVRAMGAQGAQVILVCRPPHPRALVPEEVVASLRTAGMQAQPAASIPAAIERALAMATVEQFVLVTGSLYVVGEARSVLHRP